jgi:molybdate transport system permease protein
VIELFSSITPAEVQALKLSLWVSFWSVVISLPAGVMIAWILARKKFWGKVALDAVVHLPLALPPVVTGYLLLVFLGRKGLVGEFLYEYLGITVAFNWKGAALAAAVMAFPLLVRAVRLSIEAVDQGLEAAARTLGAGPVRVFFSITLPLILPGILTGALLAFARSLGEFGATITFVSNIPGQTRTLPLALYTFTQTPGGEAAAMRLCAVSIIISIIALALSETLNKRLQSKMEK